MAAPEFRSGELQKLLGLTRTQVLEWAKRCLAVPPLTPAHGTGHHQRFSARNAIDLALVRELVDHGLSLRRVRNILSSFRQDPYSEADQKAAIAAYLRRWGQSDAKPCYDFLILYQDPRAGRRRLVGRATGTGTRWWQERTPKRFVNEFVDRETAIAVMERNCSLTVVNIGALRRLVYGT